ncbi:twin-arginine translocase TatA/TatE family subunit [Anaplasma phagocytophilum]|uniref:Sec-independent protein translocase subunit TatB n=1 Tax=Anaplasma phagocytophilum TaxID=948 RepID=UPI00201B31EF
MLNIGISEVLLIVVVGCLVTDPKKLPTLLKSAGAYYRKFEAIKGEILDSLKGVCEEPDSDPSLVAKDAVVIRGTKQIIGDDGMVYEAFDVDDLVKNRCTDINTRLDDNPEVSCNEEDERSVDNLPVHKCVITTVNDIDDASVKENGKK